MEFRFKDTSLIYNEEFDKSYNMHVEYKNKQDWDIFLSIIYKEKALREV